MAGGATLRAVALAVIAACAQAVIVNVHANADECFMERVDAANKLQGSFEVLSGGLLDIDCAVYGPNNELHYSVTRQKTGSFSVMAPSTGVYRMCLSNRMSTLSEKSVAFSLHTGDELFRDVAKQEHITPLETEITQLADAVTKLQDEQQYMWAREKTSHETNESTNARVLWFSVAETAVLIILGVWQVLTLKSFLEKKRLA